LRKEEVRRKRLAQGGERRRVEAEDRSSEARDEGRKGRGRWQHTEAGRGKVRKHERRGGRRIVGERTDTSKRDRGEVYLFIESGKVVVME
jgi:hypothetical protein